MAQPGPSDYRTAQSGVSSHDHTEGIMDQVSATARDMGERAGTIVGELGIAIKERPYTILAVAAGLAFAVGALWKLGHQRPQTRFEALRARMPDAWPQIQDAVSRFRG